MSEPSVDSLFGAPPVSTNAPQVEEKDLKKLARAYLAADAALAAMEEKAKEARKVAERAELQLLDAMKAAGLKSFRMDDTGQLLTSAIKNRFQLPPRSDPEQRALALRWLKRVGARAIVQEDANPQSVTAFLLERLEQGKSTSPTVQVPDVDGTLMDVDVIKSTEFRYLSVRKK